MSIDCVIGICTRPRHLIAAACAAACLGAQAAPFELTYSGWFSTGEALNLQSDASPTYFSATTPFILQARFDDSSPNLAPLPPSPSSFDGYRAYAPTSMVFYIGSAGQFAVNGTDNPGLSVSIFDQQSFDPGHYAVGVIVDAVADGAGIVGDFRGASPAFAASALTATTFTDFAGVGHSSGICISGGGATCTLHNVTPIVLRDAGNTAWNLTLASFETDLPAERMNMAAISAVPEPSTYGLMLAGLGLLAWAARARRR